VSARKRRNDRGLEAIGGAVFTLAAWFFGVIMVAGFITAIVIVVRQSIL